MAETSSCGCLTAEPSTGLCWRPCTWRITRRGATKESGEKRVASAREAFMAVLVFSGGSRNRKVRLGPRGKIRRLLAGDFVGQRDRVTRIRAEIRMRLEVGEHRSDVCGAGEPGRKN